MKVIIIGSHSCPDTLYVLYKLTEKQVNTDFKDLSVGLPDLRRYLGVRERNETYESACRAGGTGIPYFELEDGTGTSDSNKIMVWI